MVRITAGMEAMLAHGEARLASKKATEDANLCLFELPPPRPIEPKVRQIRYPIWTENKARLIERYLYYFVLVTRHGTYIDGFAGPQETDKPDMWAAKLVLESRPRWFRHFHLCDKGREQIAALRQLRDNQPPRDRTRHEPNRTVEIYEGDFNLRVNEILGSRAMKDTEATFCLLDQRTFECRWSTVETLARFKARGNKIELFYFLANRWLDRALAAQRDEEVLRAWWGRDDWASLRGRTQPQRVMLFVERFKEELGYKSVKPWPIRERMDGGAVMYYMIHATDHPAAPALMDRAYRKAVLPKETPEQFALALGLPPPLLP